MQSQKPLPSEAGKLKAALRQQQQKQMEQHRIRFNELKRCINVVASSEEGRIALRYIALELCGFGKTKVVGDIQSKTVCPVSTAFNAAQENIWLKLRSFIRPQTLFKIEYSKQEEV